MSQIKDKWEEILGEDKEWGDPIVINPVTIDTALNRFNYNNGTVSENPNAMKSFIEAYKEAYKKLKTEGKTIERLKEKFEDLDKDGYSYLTGDDYTEFGGKYYDPKSEKEKDAKNIAGFNTPKFNETSNLYIQNSPIRKGTSCGDIEHKNSNNIDPCTLEKYASEDKYRVVQNVDEKDKDGKPVTTRTVVNSYYLDVQKVDGKSVTTKKVIGSISYTAALSVRYCTITVNDVFCDGTISVLESKIPGFENAAAVNVKNNYLCSDSVKNELKKASIMDFLKNVLQKNNAQLTDEEILKEYFGIDGNKNNFKAETKLYFDMQNKYNNSETSKEWWVGLDLLNKPTITHNRKFIVLRAHMELTETAKWTNKPYVVAHEEYWYNKEAKKNKDKHYSFYENWSNPEYSNSGWRYVFDLLYCLEDNNDYDGSYNGDKDLAGKIINARNGEEVKYKDLWDNEKAAVDLIRASVDGKINTVNLDDAVFLDYQSGKEFEKSVYDDYVKKGLLEGYTNDPSAAGADFPKHKQEFEKTHQRQSSSWFSDELKDCEHKWKYYDSAEKSHTVYYYFGLKPFKDITGGSELDGYDKLSYVLNGNDILTSAFLNTGYLIAMFSNGANDFDGIINGLVNDSAINGGKLKTFGLGSTSNQFDAMKGTTRAFSEGLYGMYLVVDNRYSLVDNTATVKAIFEEIKSPEFATVVEANANQEQSKANVRKILADLQDKGDIEEYNAFDIYGDTYSGETQAGKTKDYVCAKGGKLTKKKFKISFSEPTNAESWTKVGALWCYIESSNDVEDSGSLRLMDFYNKDVENGKHLRADSTFAIDEKYNETFTGLKDKKTEILKGNFTSLTVNRSEVQYTIEQNTYFNFGLSKKEIVFAASTDGVDKRVRMNFLIDTSKKDIYIFFYCPALDTTKSKEEQIRFVFNKCSFQVTGKNNAYLMLVDDTSFAANAHSMEISNSLGSEDKTDEKVGTHFKSNTYQQYVAKLKGDGIKYTYNILDFFESFVDDLLDATQMQALPKGDPKKVGNMFIIGMGSNNIKFGRGGTVNALIYIPHGRYSNESSGILSIIPIASSGNNEASIIAKDIYIGGSNRGKLIFTSYDVSRMGTKNSNSSGLVMDSLINPDTVSHDTKWVAGDYYYG